MSEAAPSPEEYEARRQASFQGLSAGRPAPWSTPEERLHIADILREFRDDPLGFALWAYPWRVKGTRLEEAELEKWQVQVLDTLGKQIRARVSPIRIGVASGHGIGKAQPGSLLIDTPTGQRRFGDLEVGDTVFGSDGRAVRVTSTHEQGVIPVYRVGFDDKSSTVACADHLWSVRGRNDRRRNLPNWRVRSTQDLLNKGVKRKNGRASARQWEIPMSGAAQYSTQWVPVDPYTLGAWLGDGRRRGSQTTNLDLEVPTTIEKAGYRVTSKTTRSKARDYNVGNLIIGLRHAGVSDLGSHERYVPAAYKENVATVRSAVLRGLLDTDGYVTPTGAVIFSSSSPRLAADVAWLGRSLGGKIVEHSPAPSYRVATDGERIPGRPCHNVTLTMPDGFKCFEIKRKMARVRPTTQKRYLARWIDSIEPAGEEDCRCITVDAEDGLYLTNDFIVTHNTGLMAIINHWFVSTHPDPQLVVTANTDQQLRNKTWRELAIWLNMSRLSWMFQWNATTLRHRDRPETWYSTAVPWSEGNAEAFAGTHEVHTMLLFDEASKIAPAIWEMAFGALTTPNAIMIVFGNPTQNTGPFYDIFGKMRQFWSTLRVDSRTIKGKFVNHKLHQEWVDFYGIDSDFVRVKVRGLHPLQGNLQFIPSWLVEGAEKKHIKDEHLPALAPKVMGVDVAREGDDHSTIVWRKSKKMFPHYERMQIRDLMMLAAHIAKRINETQPDACFIDALGMGAGVYDRLVMLGYGSVVIPVYWGKAALEKKIYINHRVECWARMKLWLDGADIPYDAIMHEELIGPMFGYERRTERLSLETKREMKARGLDSPDLADGLALTFAEFVAHRTGGVGESRVVAPEAA